MATTFGQRLRQLRKENQLTTVQLGKILESDNSSISRYENDLRDPKPHFIEKACKYFGVTSDYLLGVSDERIPTEKLPARFDTAEDAIAFLIKQPTLVAFGGYDLSKLSSDELIDFANDILRQIEVVSYKYRK